MYPSVPGSRITVRKRCACAEPVCTLLMLLLLPPLLKLTGVWLATPIAQVITFVIACVAKRRVDAKT